MERFLYTAPCPRAFTNSDSFSPSLLFNEVNTLIIPIRRYRKAKRLGHGHVAVLTGAPRLQADEKGIARETASSQGGRDDFAQNLARSPCSQPLKHPG